MGRKKLKAVQVELTYETYEELKDALLSNLNTSIRSIVNKALEYFREITPLDAVEAIMNNKSIKDYLNDMKLYSKYRVLLSMVRGILKAKPEYLIQFQKIVTKEFILQLLKYENPETYNILINQFQKKRILNWIQKNLDDIIEILTPKKPE